MSPCALDDTDDLKDADRLAEMLGGKSGAHAVQNQAVESLNELVRNVRLKDQFKLTFAGKYKPTREGGLLENLRVRSPLILRWPIDRRD